MMMKIFNWRLSKSRGCRSNPNIFNNDPAGLCHPCGRPVYHLCDHHDVRDHGRSDMADMVGIRGVCVRKCQARGNLLFV